MRTIGEILIGSVTMRRRVPQRPTGAMGVSQAVARVGRVGVGVVTIGGQSWGESESRSRSA